MNRIGILFLLSLIGMSFYSCSRETEFDGFVLLDEYVPPININCDYTDTAIVRGYPGMDSAYYRISVRSSTYTNDQIFIEYIWSSDYLVIQSLKPFGFGDITSLEVDFSDPQQNDVRFYILRGGISSIQNPAIEGKMYLKRNKDLSFEIDWCDVVIKSKVTGKLYPSFGGIKL